MLHLIGQSIFGLLLGLAARAVMPVRLQTGPIPTMIFGPVGAWLGGVIGRSIGIV